MKDMEDCSVGYYSSEDTHCFIDCECGAEQFSASDFAITRCPECGRGYRTEFKVWKYEVGEYDPNHQEYDDIDFEGIKARARMVIDDGN